MADRRIHWRCFHCDATFTRPQERWAREHFGRDESELPVCQMRMPGESHLLTALRNAQEELAAHRAEDTDLMRAILAMAADHVTALRQEEERGYAKGLADADALHRKALFVCAPQHQGGHSGSGFLISEALRVPFPITMPDLIEKARAEGLDPLQLWPWSRTLQEEAASACAAPSTGEAD